MLELDVLHGRPNRFIDRSNHHILEHFHILRVHCLGVDGQCLQRMLAIHCGGDHAAARRGGVFLLLELRLGSLHICLHFLGLLNHIHVQAGHSHAHSFAAFPAHWGTSITFCHRVLAPLIQFISR